MPTDQLTLPGNVAPDTENRKPIPASEVGDSGVDPAYALYCEFRRQLWALLQAGPRTR